MEDAKLENLFTSEAFEWIKRLELKSLFSRFDSETVQSVVPDFEQFTQWTTKKEWNAAVDHVCNLAPEAVGVAFLGDPWIGAGAARKRQSKKGGGQMSLVFTEDSVELGMEQEDGEEYGFIGFSLSYYEGEDCHTGYILVSEEVTGNDILDGYHRLEKKDSEILLLDWKNALHLTKPVEVRTYGIEPAKQHGFALDTKQERKKTFASLRDLGIGAYLLNPLKDTYQADDIARDYLHMTLPSYQELFGKETLAAQLARIDEEETAKRLKSYFGYLSCIPLMAWAEMKKQLAAEGMLGLMEEIEMPTVYYLFEMERLGVQANAEVLKEMSELLERRVLALETDIYDLAGEEFNINSPKQLGVILFEKLKLPFAKKTKTGYSTSADILEKLRTEDPIIDKILEYRQVSKLKSTYADGLPVFIEEDHRIHGKFNQTITATGRISSTDPNLQNIPIRMELGKQLRKVFEPKSGFLFLDADYSQIELRVLAHMSGDEHLIEAYRQGQDIHRATASKVFHTPFEEVTDLQRRNAKAVNFGIVYGISAFGLSQDLSISRKEADEIIHKYFESYPAIKTFLDELVAKAKDTGYAQTMFGRRRPVPELKSSNFMQRSFGERVAMNSPIQGTAADIIKIAMIRVAERLQEEQLESRIVLQVHDELLVETKIEEKEQVKRILEEEMPLAAQLQVPLSIDVEEGKNWYEAH